VAISPIAIRFLAQEHKYKPLPATVHLLGKQTILAGLDQIRYLLRDSGVEPCDIVPQYETATVQSMGTPKLADTSVFEMFGVKRVRAFDHSDFEGADIVVDLTRPVGDEHAETADLIYDGSVMDNIFNPAVAMHNVARMLKPGGRYIGFNAASIRKLPAYLAFNPYWFFDFFVANHFADVKVYVLDFGDLSSCGRWADSRVDLLDAHGDHRNTHNFPIGINSASLFIVAEKAADSTSQEYFSQGCYRLPEEWTEFDRKLARIQASPRPVMSLKRKTDSVGGTGGFHYVGNIDSDGEFKRSPDEVLPPVAMINMADTFAGYDWSWPSQHQGISWRWIEGVSTILLPPQAKPFRIVGHVHTSKGAEHIRAVRMRYAGAELPVQVRRSLGGSYTLEADAPAFAYPSQVEFHGQDVALSRVEFR
jgi:SAM-dependent methyltransferase